MLYIRSLFKTVALFCLSAVFCPGCESPPKRGEELKVSSKEKAKTPDKKPVQSGDKKASQDINQEKRKKVLEGFSQQRIMACVEEALRQQLKLPDQKIKDYVKDVKESVQDNFSKLENILNALPSDELQFLVDYCAKCQQAIDETLKQVNEKCNQLDNLLKEGEHHQIDVRRNASEPIFQDIIKVGREVLPSFEFMIKCMEMEEPILERSPQEQKTYLPRLQNIIYLFMSLGEKKQKLLIQMEKQLPKIPAHLLELFQQFTQLFIQIHEKLNSIIKQQKK